MGGSQFPGLHRLAIYTVAFAVSAVATVLAGRAIGLGSREEESVFDTRDLAARTYQVVADELVLVFVGGASCPASGTEGVQRDWAKAGRLLQRAAAENGWRLRRIGVAHSSDPRKGMRFLSRLGDFDEVAVGSGSAAIGLRRYVYADFPGPMLIPQVVVIFRRHDRNGPLG